MARCVGGSFRLFPGSSLLLPLLFLLLSTSLLQAETFTLQDPGKGYVEVGGKWQFHTGDNLAWAQPGYDDSSWEQLRGDTTWGNQTHPAYTGFAWYRTRIEETSAVRPLAILMPPVDDMYELYWNGQKIGGYGTPPPHARWNAIGHSVAYPLPSGSGILAIRVWKATLSSVDSTTSGGLESAPRIGDPEYLALQAKATRTAREHSVIPTVMASAILLATGLISLLLFVRERRKWMYLWLAVYLIANGLSGARQLDLFRNGMSFLSFQVWSQFANCASDLSLWALLLALFGLDQDPRWRRWTFVLAAIYFAAQVVDTTAIFFWEDAGKGLVWTDAITTAIYDLTPLYIIAILIGGLRRRRQMDLWPLAIVVFLCGLWSFTSQILGQGLQITHWDKLIAWIRQVGFMIADYRFDMGSILAMLVFGMLVFTVAREQYRERRRQAQIELEVKSAREVQQVLVPEAVPVVPGFAIDTVYKPAAELGGDFFQVISLPDASTLIVMGDVSGKGLKAAMTVSLIVGTLRTLAEYTQAPAEILQGLNRRLLGRIQDGFATCVVLRLEPNGSATIANAGHFPPFRDGNELPLAGSLPLGMTADSTYDELMFRLQEGETLTFYSDGIVEARNGGGELYGFERIQELLQKESSVEQIVAAACSFGQEDDITVLSISRLAEHQRSTESSLNLRTEIATA